ncbi:carboxylesterase [Holotrichia oblita]|uniref:Carboxylesterase n=1 Tax=Holotrichia oblita TaxID=644536 RepID=A0ACB9TKZ0_HOLOL|nr:carboxylesterase [Holotrichia oblita]
MYATMLLVLLFTILINYNVESRSNRIRRIVGGIEADVAPYNVPVTYVNYGEKTATVHGLLTNSTYYSFRGLRYGQSPTGARRFQRPKKYILEGNYNATEYPPPCIQPEPGTGNIIGKEDCLFLNIFTPALPEGDKGLPVILWIHGGGFKYGSASQYGPKYLMKKDVVVVTIQYRLGTLGFLSAGSSDFPGNAGLSDIALAIEWTKNYIAFFGGNAKKITVMGQGTGGSCALLVAMSKLAKGIPRAVAAMSGTAISNWAIDKTPTETAKEVAAYQGCPVNNTVSMIKCMQKVDAAAIVKGDDHIESARLKNRGFLSGLSGLLGSSPAIEGVNDGRSLPGLIQRDPLEDMSAGRRPSIPLLTGTTRDETKRAVNDKFKEEIESQLKSIPGYINEVLVEELQTLTGLGLSNANYTNPFWSVLDPLNFRPYLQSASNSIVDSFSKVSEATTDALFNLPAFMTANLWSKNNTPTFMYRFNHSGMAPKGNRFLNGLPLVSSNITTDEDDTICHGDELAYLFEPLNLDGTPLKDSQISNQQDEVVRDIFTQTITDFAKDGQIYLHGRAVPAFTGDSNNFVEISSNPEISNKFRYCEMALWAGLGERLKDASCQAQNTLLGALGAPVAPLMNIPVQLGTGKMTNAQSIPFGTLEKIAAETLQEATM